MMDHLKLDKPKKYFMINKTYRTKFQNGFKIPFKKRKKKI